MEQWTAGRMQAQRLQTLSMRALDVLGAHRRAIVAQVTAAVGIALTLGAAFAPWLSVPVVETYGPWSLPINFGWGALPGFASYGALAVVVALYGTARLAFALGWRRRPLGRRGLALLGTLMLGVTLLFVLQFLAVDFALVTRLADQENQSMLIRGYLYYDLPSQYIYLYAFGFDIATVGQRLVLLTDLFSIGLTLPLLGGLCTLYGAYLARGASPAGNATQARLPSAAARWLRLARPAAIVAVVACGVILFGRAPLGIFTESLATSALASGNYTAALNDFDLSSRLSPTMQALPAFREGRGEALARQSSPNALDARIDALAEDLRLGDLHDAAAAGVALYQANPQDPVVRYLYAMLLETQASNAARPYLVPQNNGVLQYEPWLAQVLPALDTALPPLDRLAALAPENVFAAYMHGRVLFTNHEYALAERDFQRAAEISNDEDLQSSAYTYLALCLAGQGDYAGERLMLLKAIQLDQGYYNTTARAEASGLQ